jgi:hypothetical protein
MLRTRLEEELGENLKAKKDLIRSEVGGGSERCLIGAGAV